MERYKRFFEIGNYDFSILPLGLINLKTGNSKYFNIYETWENSTAEVWKTRDNKIVLIFTSGDKPLFKINDVERFIHDQTGRVLFVATMIDFAHISEIKTKLLKYGNSLSGYTYK